jgi:hypothetical protein
VCAISASEYDIQFSGLNELIAADSLNPLYSLSYSANCRPGQLHLDHLLARDRQIPAMCGLIGPQDGDLAIPSEQVWLRFWEKRGKIMAG